MKFQVAVTSGGEVVFAGDSQRDRPVYYDGAPPETGLWRISIPKFEDIVSAELRGHSFGSSVEEFVFGFEIAELDEWGQWFKKTRSYMSYRPKHRQLVSVGQLEWSEVKNLPAEEQFAQLGAALVLSIDRIGTLKRRPKDFDYASFAGSVRGALSRCTSAMVTA